MSGRVYPYAPPPDIAVVTFETSDAIDRNFKRLEAGRVKNGFSGGGLSDVTLAEENKSQM
jgi:hypothetical protein